MPRLPSTVQLLSHLSPCSKCSYYIGAPLLCKGKNDPTHKDFWFKKCLNNHQPTPDSCDHFEWRHDLEPGKTTDRTKKTPCPGYLCREKPGSVNAECMFGVCVKCCRHLQPLLPTPRACAVGDHRKGVVYPESMTNASKGGKKVPEPVRGGRRSKVLNTAQQSPPTPLSKARRAKARRDVSPPSRAPPKRTSYATPTGPSYKGRVDAMDVEAHVEEDGLAERVCQDRVNAQLHVVTLQWWKEDGEAPDHVEVPARNPGSFHPKDIPLLVAEYQTDSQKFQYFDSKKQAWFTGSIHSAPRDLQKLGDDDLCYRSFGVTRGERMPGESKKRAAPDDAFMGSTPRRPMPTFPDYLNTPATTPRWSDSPAATEPPMSGSSSLSNDAYADHLPDDFLFDFTPPSYSPATTLYASINTCLPPLPALFPRDTDTATALPSTSTSRAAQPLIELDLSTAPRGVGTHAWPWRYVCDMAAGFDAMRRLQDGLPPMTTAQAFKDVFQGEFKVTTYGDQWRAWRAAGLLTGERECWILHGRTEAGEWLTFMRRWRQRH